jgi:hypothetical protein
VTIHRFSAEALIPAPHKRVYAIISDYVDMHKRILPRPPFVSLDVEQGGVGAGTVISFEMRVLGRTQRIHAVISEPEPGRMLVETDQERGTITTFYVEPRNDGDQTHVRITTEMPLRDGIGGAIQGWVTSRVLEPVYRKELAQLATVAAHQAPS